MSVKLLANPGGAYGEPLNTSAGLNDQVCIEVINNSGTYLRAGDVVVWDNATALSTVSLVTTSAYSLTVATQTITVSASTASFASSGALLIPVTVTGTAATNTVPVFVSYTGISGSTFTGAKAQVASVTSGAAAGNTVYQWPTATYSATAGASNVNTVLAGISPFAGVSVVGQPAAPSDGGRYVTLSQTGAVSDPLVAGVVTLAGSAETTIGTPPYAAFPNNAILPNAPFMMAVEGVARVRILGTVTAGNLMSTAVSPSYAQNATQGTLGNMLGVALEADSAKDSNNTIRVALKIG